MTTVTPASLQTDPRIERMVRTTIRSTPVVFLVGPPSADKSARLRQTIAAIHRDPGAFGFTRVPNPPTWVKAEEGWTASDLVGGETLDENQRLRFSLGYVLDAIREDRWLVVEEMNRADMDKIFGTLMTWLRLPVAPTCSISAEQMRSHMLPASNSAGPPMCRALPEARHG